MCRLERSISLKTEDKSEFLINKVVCMVREGPLQ